MANSSENMKKRTLLSVMQRLEIYNKLESGARVNQIATEYQIHPTTVRCIRRNGLKVRQLVSQSTFLISDRKKLRKPQYQDLENHLYAWFLERKTLGGPITDLLLREKALELNQEFDGPSTFRASSGWLIKFKNRRNIRLLNMHGEKESADVLAAEKFVCEFRKRIEEDGIKYTNIYNMNETSLMWKALPTKTLVHGGEHNVRGRKTKTDRITVGLCSNAIGTHKLPPLMIYKHKNPRPLKHCKNLPVTFKTQKRAGMDMTVFNDWYENHFKTSVTNYQLENGLCGKVFLILDNCGRHKVQSLQLGQDDHFEIIFLPPNTTSILQPMNQGVIAKTKRTFRHKMLRKVLTYAGGITEFYKKYNIKDCINILHEAWTETTASDIKHAWKALNKEPVTTDNERSIEKGRNDSVEPQLQNIINAITEGESSQEEINEYFSHCKEEEKILSEDEIQDGEEYNIQQEYGNENYEDHEEEKQERQINEEESQTGQHEEELQRIQHEEELQRIQHEEELQRIQYEELQRRQHEEGFQRGQHEKETQRGRKNGENSVKREIRKALAVVHKHINRAPLFLKLTVDSLEAYLLSEEKI